VSLLEDRYRYVLRLLPASYRAEREEEMVCAFLEGSGDLSDADNPRPRWSEIASVVALSVRVRLGGAGSAPRFLAWGEAIRLVAVLGLFFHAMMSCFWLGDFLRSPGVFGSPSADYQAILGAAGSAERLWNIARQLGGLLWVAAFASLVHGRPRAAKILGLLALALYYSDDFPAGGSSWGDRTNVAIVLSLLSVVPVLALSAGFHRDAPRIRRPLWVAALPVGTGVLLYAIMSVLGSIMMATINWQFWSWVWPWLGWTGLACLALLIASATCVWTHLRVPARRTPSLPLALAILIVPVALSLGFNLNFQNLDPISRTMAAVAAGQVVALLLCGLTLIVLAVRTMPALPHVTPVPGESPDGATTRP
jgi:hypothetical protein